MLVAGPRLSDYKKLGTALGKLVASKNVCYGDSFSRSGEMLKILYPNGVQPSQYRDFLTVTRVIDKLFRVATRKKAFGETPWRDIAGYSLLSLAADESENKRAKKR